MPDRTHDGSARERIVEAAGQLLRTHGYAATSMRDIVEEADAPWGSLHHYFPGGKEQLAVEALQLGGRANAEAIASCFAATRTPTGAIRRFFEGATALVERSQFALGCPIATVALETANDDSVVSRACTEIFALWGETLEHGLRAGGIDPRRARALATLVIGQYEGALLLARVQHDLAPLRAAAALMLREVGDATAARR